jgi:hypothetical protein
MPHGRDGVVKGASLLPRITGRCGQGVTSPTKSRTERERHIPKAESRIADGVRPKGENWAREGYELPPS